LKQFGKNQGRRINGPLFAKHKISSGKISNENPQRENQQRKSTAGKSATKISIERI